MLGGGLPQEIIAHLDDLFYLSMALCVDHHSNRKMGTAMYELQEMAGPNLLTKCWSLRDFDGPTTSENYSEKCVFLKK